MALTHSTAARNAIAAAFAARVDAGSALASGLFGILEGESYLVTLFLSNPAFGAPSNGVIALNGTPIEGEADDTGVADTFEFLNRDLGIECTGTVTGLGGGGDVEINNPSITASEAITLKNYSWMAPLG